MDENAAAGSNSRAGYLAAPTLQLSHEDDAAVLRDEAGRDTLARGLAEGILAYLAQN